MSDKYLVVFPMFTSLDTNQIFTTSIIVRFIIFFTTEESRGKGWGRRRTRWLSPPTRECAPTSAWFCPRCPPPPGLHPVPPAGDFSQRPRENYPPGDCSCGGCQAAALNFSCSLIVLELVCTKSVFFIFYT